MYVGLAVSSYFNSATATAVFDNVTVVPLATGQTDFYVTTAIPVPAYTSGSSDTAQTIPLSVAAVNGFAGTVTLSAAGLPGGVAARFRPGTVSGSRTADLSLTTPASLA